MASTEDKEMSFIEHLDELRVHLIRIVIILLCSALFVFIGTKTILEEVIFGPLNDHFLTYRVMCTCSNLLGWGDTLCYDPPSVNLITLEMGEAFFLHIKICLFGGLILAFPFALWEFWKFIRPGLYSNEKKAANGFVFVSGFLFVLGVLFGYFVLSPFAINFLLGYDLPMINADVQNNIIKATSMINYMIMFTLPVGIIFELPIVVFYLSKIGLITDKSMKKYRKHSIVIILIVAAFITPPDVMTQIIIGVPIYILYEISISIAAVQTRKREKQLVD